MYKIHIDEWGTVFWQALHTISFTYPNTPTTTEKTLYRTTIRNLARVLPCSVCKNHFMRYIRDNPPLMSCKYTLSKWMVSFHNSVNRRLGKPQRAYEDIVEEYIPPTYMTRTSCTENNNNKSMFVYGLLIFIFVVFCTFLCLIIGQK